MSNPASGSGRRPDQPAGGAPASYLEVFVGIVRLARFDAAGLACFPGSTDGFLSSIAPLLGFALVGAGVVMANSGGLEAAEELSITVCALLAPSVLSHLFAHLWRTEERWLRYATAFNWCQWAIPVAASVLLLVLSVAMMAGLPNRYAGMLAVGALFGYALALHWFLARHGLGLSVWRALFLVLGTNLGTALLVLLPRLAVVLAGLDR